MFQEIWRVDNLSRIRRYLRRTISKECQTENIGSSHRFTIEFRMVVIKRFWIAIATAIATAIAIAIAIATASQFKEDDNKPI
jgi:hypothetical protein